MIELVEGFWVYLDDIKAVKRISDDKCSVWLTGQSAMDGFVVDSPAEAILDTLGYPVVEDDEEDEDTEEEDQDDDG